MSSSVNWLPILKAVWKRSLINSNFWDLPSNVRIIVVSDFSNMEILLILLWKSVELLLFANCWRANKIWSAPPVAEVFSLRNCGWLVELFFYCFREDVMREQYVTSFWTPVTMAWASSGPEFVVWLWVVLASGRESL